MGSILNLNFNMRKEMTLQTREDIFRIRNLLQQISHISFTFSNLSKKYPIENLTEEEARDVLRAYINLIFDTKKIWEDFTNINLNFTHDNKSTD